MHQQLIFSYEVLLYTKEEEERRTERTSNITGNGTPADITGNGTPVASTGNGTTADITRNGTSADITGNGTPADITGNGTPAANNIWWFKTTWNCDKNEERSGKSSLLTPRDTRKLYGVVKSDRKRPLQEITNNFNEYRARPVSVQRKLYESKYHKCVVNKSTRIRDYNVKKRLAWCKLNT